MQTFLRCRHSPLVQSHASASVRTLKIPNTGSHIYISLFGHTKILHTSRNWVALLLRLMCLTQVTRPKSSARDKESLNTCQKSRYTCYCYFKCAVTVINLSDGSMRLSVGLTQWQVLPSGAYVCSNETTTGTKCARPDYFLFRSKQQALGICKTKKQKTVKCPV